MEARHAHQNPLARPMDAEDALMLANRGYMGVEEPEAELSNGTHG